MVMVVLGLLVTAVVIAWAMSWGHDDAMTRGYRARLTYRDPDGGDGQVGQLGDPFVSPEAARAWCVKAAVDLIADNPGLSRVTMHVWSPGVVQTGHLVPRGRRDNLFPDWSPVVELEPDLAGGGDR
jgi:hypothetical protein